MNYKRRIISTLLLVLLLFSILPTYAATTSIIAKPSKQRVAVDGKEVSFRAYNIGGNNYYMLRDMAYVLNGTMAQFQLGWNQVTKAISLETGKAYTGIGEGFQMKTIHKEEYATKTNGKIHKNNKEISLNGYNIGGYNYFKLRDLADEIGFQVFYDEEEDLISIISDKTIKVTRSTSSNSKRKMVEEILKHVNAARQKEGIKPLVLDENLVAMAEYKVSDMRKLNKVSHDGSYGKMKDLYDKFDIDYKIAGENCLVGGKTSDHIFKLWWDSPNHRKNMMNPDFGKIGIGIEDATGDYCGCYFAVQEFTD